MSANAVVTALASAWQAIGQQHDELPAVLIGIGRGSRPGAKRRTLGHFGPCAWVPVSENRAPELRASSNVLQEAMVNGDLATLSRVLSASAGLVLREAAQLSRDASQLLGEVVLTDDGLARSPIDVLAIVLPWRRGRIQTLGMPSRDRASSCSACWNVGNSKGCQSDVGNLDGCPHRVNAIGGDWMWNPNAAATATSTASKMKIISANCIEPAADFRRALGERKRGQRTAAGRPLQWSDRSRRRLLLSHGKHAPRPACRASKDRRRRLQDTPAATDAGRAGLPIGEILLL